VILVHAYEQDKEYYAVMDYSKHCSRICLEDWEKHKNPHGKSTL